MSRLPAVALTLLALALPAGAQTLTPIVGSAMVDQSAAAIDAMGVAIDTDNDSRISLSEMETAAQDVFASMDADADGFVSKVEMIDWPYGLGDLARFRGREAEFDLAMSIVFDLMDGNGDGAIDAVEHSAGLALAWRLGDRNRDGRLSLTEFRDDFLVTNALRRGVGSATVR